MTVHNDEEHEQALTRRSFLGVGAIGVAGFAASGSLLAACASGSASSTATEDEADGNAEGTIAEGAESDEEVVELAQDEGLPELTMDMATSWPASLVTLQGAAEIFAQELSRLTGGRFKVTPRPAGEIVGGLEVLPTVRDGGVEMGHTASYYYTGLNTATQFGTAVPFGLTSRQQNAWLYEGGGLEMLREFYASEFGVIQFPAGNTGVQMGGWFTKEINSVSDIQGLKMRIPGIAGQVLNNMGGEQVSVAGGDILPSIETGAIDAAEFVGPTDDLILGLDQLGSTLYYYYPGWWEPGPSLEVEMRLETWNELPELYQAAVENAAATANIRTMAKYDVLNPQDLQKVKEFAELRPFPDDVMSAFKEENEKVLDGLAAENGQFGDILGPWREYKDQVQEWHALAETAMMNSVSI